MAYRKPYPPEVRERAVRMVFEKQDDGTTQWVAIRSLAEMIARSGEALRPSGRGRRGTAAGSDERRV